MVSFISSIDNFFCQKSLKRSFLASFMALSLIMPFSANANPNVGPGCDPVFMASIQKKAWMEAQREIMIAQTTIAKPDSVFALGCFGNFASGFTTGQFSNGTLYDYQAAIDNFVDNAFAHTYGGGHYNTNNSGSNSACGDMQALWTAARCANLDLPSKLLYTLQDMSGYDRGDFPAACGAAAWADPLDTIYGAKVANKSVGASFDDMNLFTDVVAPLSQVSGGKCSKGIPTGVKVDVSGAPRDEIICPNPGCVSNGANPPKCCDYAGGNCSN